MVNSSVTKAPAAETRNPKSEGRKKSEVEIPKISSFAIVRFSDFCLLTDPGVLTRAAYLSTVCPCTRSGEPMGGNTGQSRRTKCANGLSRAGPMLKPKCGRKASQTGSCSTSFLSSPKSPSSLRREVRLPHFLSRPVPGPIRWPRLEWFLASYH